MKQGILILTLFLYLCSNAQVPTYNPTSAKFTLSNKAYGPAQAVPSDARSMFYDSAKAVFRPYLSTAEVLTYLNLTKYRQGNFPIIVNSGGTRNTSTGLVSGGINYVYWFGNGTADVDLIQIMPGIGATNSGTDVSVIFSKKVFYGSHPDFTTLDFQALTDKQYVDSLGEINVLDARLSANIPRIASANIFTNVNRFSSGLYSGLNDAIFIGKRTTAPYLDLYKNDGTTNQKRWSIYTDNDSLHFSTPSDDESTIRDWLVVSRNATVPRGAIFYPNVSYNAARALGALDFDYKQARDSAIASNVTDVYFSPLNFDGNGNVDSPFLVKNYNPLGYRKVVPNANYTVDSLDSYIILPDPSATRTLTLVAPTIRSKPVTIYCAATTNGEWVLNGSYVSNTITGSTFTENIVNGNIGSSQLIKLVPILDGSTWRWFDLH